MKWGWPSSTGQLEGGPHRGPWAGGPSAKHQQDAMAKGEAGAGVLGPSSAPDWRMWWASNLTSCIIGMFKSSCLIGVR